MRNDLTPDQISAMRKIGWRTPAERKALHRREWLGKLGMFAKCAGFFVAMVVVLLRFNR